MLIINFMEPFHGSLDFFCLYHQKTLILSQPQRLCFPKGEFAQELHLHGEIKTNFFLNLSADSEAWSCERQQLTRILESQKHPLIHLLQQVRQILLSHFFSQNFEHNSFSLIIFH